MAPTPVTTRLLAVVGPTATGKTALAIELALAAGAEVVSIDSQQVYRGLDVGTGKATAAERARVPHHLLDVADPDEPMTAGRFARLADAAIADITARGKPVVAVGGTGLYLRTLIYGLFEGPPVDPALRAQLDADADAHGTESLWPRLATIDPAAAARIMPRDRLRLVRALEIHAQAGVTMSVHQAAHDHRTATPRYDVRVLGLEPPREELRARIEARVAAIFDGGLLDEVRALLAAGISPESRAFLAIGYRDALACVRGEVDEPTARARVLKATWRYARRQLGWFRSERNVTWYRGPSAVDLRAETAWIRGLDRSDPEPT